MASLSVERVGKKRPGMALQSSSKRGRSMGDVSEMLSIKQVAPVLPTSREKALRQQRQKAEKEDRRKARRALQKEAEQKLERAKREEGEGDKISAWIEAVVECPVFRPTKEEFRDPLKYIKYLETQVASKYGICKIIPPYVNKVFSGREKFRNPSFTMEVRRQPLKMVDWEKKDNVTKGAEFNKDKKIWTFKDFEQFANDFVQREYEGSSSQLQLRFIEREFWSEFLLRRNKHVRYASDVPGTAFDTFEELSKSDWNLGELPSLADSVLRNVTADIPGVTKPMLYVGMLFSMFAWHVEDQYLYSINYHHLGAPKTWYGVPGCAAQGFERVAAEKVFSLPLDAAVYGESMARTLRLLIGKTIMFPPGLLVEAGVPVCRAVQQPGEFVVTFPRSYHAGFSNGFNCGEAVNFAMADWFPYGVACARRYRLLKQVHVVAHDELLCKEARDLHARMKEPGFELSELAVHTMVEFVRLLRWQQRQLWVLQQRGVPAERMDDLEGTSMECAFCLHKTYLAHVVCDCTNGAPICFNHPDLLRACRCPGGIAGTSRQVVAYLTELPSLLSIAQDFESYPGIPERMEAAAQAELRRPELADEWQLCGRREEPMGGLLTSGSREQSVDRGACERWAPITWHPHPHEDAVGVRSLQPGTPSQHKGDELAGGSQGNSREGSPNCAKSKLAIVPFLGPPEPAESLMRAHSSGSQVDCAAKQEGPALRNADGAAAGTDTAAAPTEEAVLESSSQEAGRQDGREAGGGAAEIGEEPPLEDRIAESVRRQASNGAVAHAEHEGLPVGRTDRSKDEPDPPHLLLFERDGGIAGEQDSVAEAGAGAEKAAVVATVDEPPSSKDAGISPAPDRTAAILRQESNGQASIGPDASIETAAGFESAANHGVEGATCEQAREVAGDALEAAHGGAVSMQSADDAVRVGEAADAGRGQPGSLDGLSITEEEGGASGQQADGGATEPGATCAGSEQPTMLSRVASFFKRRHQRAQAEENERLVGSPEEQGSAAPPQMAGAVGQREAATSLQEAHESAVIDARQAASAVGLSRIGLPPHSVTPVLRPHSVCEPAAAGRALGLVGRPTGASLPEPSVNETGIAEGGFGASAAARVASRVHRPAGALDRRGEKHKERALSEEPVGRKTRAKGAARTCQERTAKARRLGRDWQSGGAGKELPEQVQRASSPPAAGSDQLAVPNRMSQPSAPRSKGAAALAPGALSKEQRLEARKQGERVGAHSGSEPKDVEARPSEEHRPSKRQATAVMMRQHQQRRFGEHILRSQLVADQWRETPALMDQEKPSFDLNGPPAETVP